MLTLANFNTTQAKTYYKRENYYSQEEAQANSEWRGHGASKYQLSGPIDALDAYENIVNGYSPDGKTQLRQKQSHKDKKERAGVDLTFSAPKSVSLACLVGGDNRLEEAHRIAVRRTIDLIEERYAFTRINDERIKTGNLIVAVWHHDTSRELDPHLRSHCLLMNCTQAPDGKWRTLSNEEFFRNKILLGQIYRNELALECKKLGYEIESHPKELFEIKGYTREQIEAFSKRHEQIKEKLAEIGVEETTENKIWAWRKTRVKKNHEIERQEMLPYWHSEADLYGITHPLPEQNFHLATTQKEVEAELTTVVKAGIEHCSERKVAFKSEEIEKFVTAKTRPFGIGELQQAIFSHPELIKTFDGRYTTQSAWNRELATIRLMQQGKRVITPITHPETIEGYLEDKTLTSGQREAVKVAATTTDSFIAWQGVAGAGKIYALSELKQITVALLDVAPGYAIKGFAPSAEAAKVLEEELGIEANTVARLLVSQQSEQAQPNQIWIVDEAGLLSAKAAHELLQRATDERARVILVGDTRQLSAIEAGNPFKSLQQAGIQTAHLSESLRQKAPDLQKAVSLAAAGQIKDALAHLNQVGRIEEIPDVEERTNRIATEYIKLAPEERQNTLILAGTHKEQSAIVNSIRAALKQESMLGYGVEAIKLKALDLTKVQARYAHHYSVGDVVVPSREYRRSGLHKSQPYTVEAVVGDKLTLSDLAGNHLMVDPMKFRKSVYKIETSEIAVGERLRWTRNDKELGRRNGQEFAVTQIEGQTATIEFLDGETSSIDISQPLHCDYALVSTTYSAQGKTAERVLISSTVDLTVSQESVYVAISRAKHDLRIFAEDREWMFEQARESNAQETVLALLPASQQVQSRLAPQAKLAQLQLVLAQNLNESNLQSRFDEVMDAAALIDELRPETEQLVQAIHNWQSEQEVSVAISIVSGVVQQLEQGQNFDFGGLAELLNSATEKQLLTATGLEVKLADIAQQLEEFTVEVPTQFEGMSELVENLQSVQAESQLLEEQLTDQVAAFTDLLAHFSNKPHEYEFEGITEIAQLFSQKQTQTSLSNTLEEIAELALHLERRKALIELAQTVHSLNVHWQYQSSGLPEQLQAISEQTTELNNKVINYKFRGMNELAGTIYERHAAEAISEHLQSLRSGVERVDKLVCNHPHLQQLAETVRSLRSKMASLQPQIPQERQQMEVQPSPTIQTQTDRSNVARKPLTNQKAQALEQQRLVYRQKYQELQKRVRSYPGFSNSPNLEVDIGVALLVVKESSDPNEVKRLLTQSDQLQEWKAVLPKDEYMAKGKIYIHQVYEQAQRLREVRSLQRQQKGDLDLEL